MSTTTKVTENTKATTAFGGIDPGGKAVSAATAGAGVGTTTTHAGGALDCLDSELGRALAEGRLQNRAPREVMMCLDENCADYPTRIGHMTVPKGSWRRVSRVSLMLAVDSGPLALQCILSRRTTGRTTLQPTDYFSLSWAALPVLLLRRNSNSLNKFFAATAEVR